MNRLNGRGDGDDYDERIIIRITGMVRLSKETWFYFWQNQPAKCV